MSPRLIDTFLENVIPRRTVRNWPSEIAAIVDGYRSYTTISHAVQKDAVQNSWSARMNRRGRGWKLTFDLVMSGRNTFLQIIDEGTTGLTGRILTPEEYGTDLPSEERWGRFEGVAFTQPRGDRTLGSRGRGKFIFVGASKEYTVLYDTLRRDGTYRLGFRTVTRTESPVYSRDGDGGREMLVEMTGGLISPLDTVGTRVIIVNPVDEIIEDIRTGRFIRHIGETWWEIISKHNAAIVVRAFDNENAVTIPEEFILPTQDTNGIKTFVRPAGRIRLGPATEIKLKKLHIVYNRESPAPEDISGIAIQRDGMKICSVKLRYIAREIADKIHGYITLDAETEEALLADEGIEHYSYDFRRALPGAVKRFIEDELLRFAQDKLGYGVDAREIRRQQQREAERMALSAINSFTRVLGIGMGPGVGPRGTGGERTPRDVRIQLDDLGLPRPHDLRVNYGETVGNIKLRIVNDSDEDIELRLRFFLRYFDQVIRTYADEDIAVSSNSYSPFVGPFEEYPIESTYPSAGKYTVVARILSLREDNKGIELDRKTKGFYLEEDPPMRGLFERCEAIGFPNDAPIKYWIGYSEIGSERGLILNYNVSHPTYDAVAESLEDLAEHILRIASHETCRYDLLQQNLILFRDVNRENPEEILKREREIVGEILYKFHRREI